MEIRVATLDDQEHWDRAVEASPHGRLFHTWRWLQLLEQHSRQTMLGRSYPPHLYPLLAFEQEELVGLLPLFCYRTPRATLVKSGSIQDDTLYLGMVLPGYERLRPEKRQHRLVQFQKAADEFIRSELHPSSVEIRLAPGIEDCRSFLWNGYQATPGYSYALDLGIGKEAIWSGMQRRLRSNIAKQREIGISVEAGGRSAFERLSEQLRSRGRGNASPEFWAGIFDACHPARMQVFTAFAGGEPLTGVVLATYKDRTSTWIGTPKCSFRETSPNELLIWETIVWSIEHGYRSYELIGADDQNTYPFKSRFGGALETYYTVKWTDPLFDAALRARRAIRAGASRILHSRSVKVAR